VNEEFKQSLSMVNWNLFWTKQWFTSRKIYFILYRSPLRQMPRSWCLVYNLTWTLLIGFWLIWTQVDRCSLSYMPWNLHVQWATTGFKISIVVKCDTYWFQITWYWKSLPICFCYLFYSCDLYLKYKTYRNQSLLACDSFALL